jgi:hypothetical protein
MVLSHMEMQQKLLELERKVNLIFENNMCYDQTACKHCRKENSREENKILTSEIDERIMKSRSKT